MTPSSYPGADDPPTGPAAATRRNWLALTSFLLSFSPLVAWVLTFAVSAQLFPPTPATGTYTYDYTGGYFRMTCLVGLASLFGSMSAVVTGTLALRQAKEFPMRQTWLVLARTGRMLGILGIVADFIITPCTFISIVAQNYHGG